MIIKIISAFLSLAGMITCAFPSLLAKKAESFRLTAYVVGSGFADAGKIDASHFSQLTDVILIGVSDFDTEGNIILNENFETILKKLKAAMGSSSANLYVNLIGPSSKEKGETWEEQMDLLAKEHNKAFSSGKLEKNIKAFLEKYSFDGVFFDYEYPLTKEHYAVFDDFIISLDKELGNKYKIGCAISSWNALQSRKAIRATDMIEVMSYDIWDEDGTHASTEAAKNCIYEMLKRGYPRKKLDIGIPFYARPTNHGAYWYSYRDYAKDIDGNGLCEDSETGLTFSFNTYDTVYEKTQWAIECGIGGAMVWHYACDTPKTDSRSLFNAMYNAKTDLINTVAD